MITLRRGLAGKKKTDLQTIAALGACLLLFLFISVISPPLFSPLRERPVAHAGLRKPWQTVERPNTADIRGQVNKARHLLDVELKEHYLARLEAAAAKAAPREPLTLPHD